MDTNKANFSQRLPRFVVRYRLPSNENVINVVSNTKKLGSIEEKKLRRFFKCTKFNLRSGQRSDQCFVCKNSKIAFEDHLQRRHDRQKFYCCYCYPRINDENKDKRYMDSVSLVKHMILCHSNRRFQCNLCLYRSISAQHVCIHMSLIHSDIYKSTLNKKQLNGKCCQILECPPPTTASANKRLPNEVQMFTVRKHRRLNNDENHLKDYQCVYCDFMNENIPKIVEHCVQNHPDYYILYYVPEPLVTSTYSPPRQQTYSDIDMFQTIRGTHETQDNRVTSSESVAANKNKPAIRTEHIDGFDGFKKKVRISSVQPKSSSQKSAVSSKRFNKYPSHSSSFQSPFVKRRPGFSKLHKLGAPHITKRLNQLTSGYRPLPKRPRNEKIFTQRNESLEPKRNKVYESDDSSDEIYISPKRVPKVVPKKALQQWRPTPTSPMINAQNYESDEMSRPSTSYARKTTTIEIAEPESDEETEETAQYICLFCDKTCDDRFTAIVHLEDHIPEINDAMYDIEEYSEVSKWGKTFIDKQMALFEEERNVEDIEYHLKCPICVKIARIKQLRPKGFRTLWEVRSHVWEHSIWTPVKCLKCKGDHFFPNSDHLIAKHLNAKHSEKLSESPDPNIRGLFGNKAKNDFEPKQRRALFDKQFISIKPFERLDKQIEVILNEVNAQHETYLREKAGKAHNLPIILPEVVVKPLPQLNFDDFQMITDFIERNERKDRVKPIEPKKPIDSIDLGSSSEWEESVGDSDDGLPSIHTYSGTKSRTKGKIRKSPALFGSDSDESSIEERPQHQKKSQNSEHKNKESSDDDIEIVEPTTSPSPQAVDTSVEQRECSQSVQSEKESSESEPLETPSKSTNSSTKMFECQQCFEIFESKKDIRVHSEKHTVPAVFKRV